MFFFQDRLCWKPFFANIKARNQMDIVDILTNIMLMCVANMDCKSDEDNETEAILDKASISNVGVKARARVFTFRVLITLLCDAVVTGLIVTSFEGIFHFLFIIYVTSLVCGWIGFLIISLCSSKSLLKMWYFYFLAFKFVSLVNSGCLVAYCAFRLQDDIKYLLVQ